MEIRTFRDLVAWQKVMELTKLVYRLTKDMPESERFGLTPQMRRAAVSIPSNIAEGYGCQSRIDYVRFLKTAWGSLMELQTQVILAQDLGFLTINDHPNDTRPDNVRLNELLSETDRVLQGLIRSLEPPK